MALGFPDEAEKLGLSLARALVSVEVIYSDQGTSVEESDAREVIAYLAHCVYLNRRPVLYPNETERWPDYGTLPEFAILPTLGDWVRTLKLAPRVDGKWPTLAGPWHKHWAWQVREDERLMARRKHEEEIFARE